MANVPHARIEDVAVSDSMPRGAVRRLMRVHVNELRFCYEQGLNRFPELLGEIGVRFSITRTGTVGDAALVSSTVGHAMTEACILEAVRRWQYPSPARGAPVEVTARLVLEPPEDGAGISTAPW